MMQVLIDLAKNESADERVRAVCAVAELDRGGVRPIDFDPAEELKNARKPAFNPADFSMDERAQIEATLRLIVDRKKEKARALADT
jgi:hypothetical protein